MTWPGFALALPIALCVACNGGATAPTPSVLRVVTDQARYTLGATGQVRILNVSESPVFYNECSRSLDRHDVAGWAEVPWRSPLEENCVDILRTLAAGAEVAIGFQFPDTLGGGTYRWRFDAVSVEESAGPLPLWERVSTPFLVTP